MEGSAGLRHSHWMHEDYLVMVERGVNPYTADHLCYVGDCITYLNMYGFINKEERDRAWDKMWKAMYKAEKDARHEVD